VLLAFLVLAALYESWTLPLAVILIVPMCLLCALFGVWLTGRRQQRVRAGGPGRADGPGVQERDPDRRVRARAGTAGQGIVEAALEACRLRLRPIVMTSVAFIAGTVPLVLSPAPVRKCAPPRHHRVRRHARRDPVRPVPDPGVLRGLRKLSGRKLVLLLYCDRK
jgi:hypothetical protein